MTRPADPALSRLWRRHVSQRIGLLALTALVLLLLAFADLLTGPSFLPPGTVLTVLFGPPHTADPMASAIVFTIRLPMLLMALVVGASLGVAGAEMQTILGNPLASPYTLGFSAAAGFGAAIVILTGFQLPILAPLTVPLVAFFTAFSACLLVYGFARLRGVTAEVLVLAGIATMFLFQSAQSLVQYMAAPEVLQEIVFWLFGSLLKASWESVVIAGAIFAFCLGLLVRDFWKLTALRLGDERAASLGVNVPRLRLRVFFLVSLLTAGAVSFVGTIGFVGLVAPHLARMMGGEDQRIFIPLSALSGAILMIGASLASKLIAPGSVVPIGIVTALVGVPFLFYLILRGRRRYW